MELAMGKHTDIGQYYISNIKTVVHLISIIVVCIEFGVLAFAVFRGKRKIKGSIKAHCAVPASVVFVISIWRKRMFNAGLVNETVVFIGELLKKVFSRTYSFFLSLSALLLGIELQSRSVGRNLDFQYILDLPYLPP